MSTWRIFLLLFTFHNFYNANCFTPHKTQKNTHVIIKSHFYHHSLCVFSLKMVIITCATSKKRYSTYNTPSHTDYFFLLDFFIYVHPFIFLHLCPSTSSTLSSKSTQQLMNETWERSNNKMNIMELENGGPPKRKTEKKSKTFFFLFRCIFIQNP